MVYAAAATNVSLPEMSLQTITSPFARLSTAISGFVEGNLDTIVNAERYKAENEELRQTIAELQRQIVDIDELLTDNRLLREMLDISAENPDFEWPDNIARITARNANDVFGGFTIDLGSEDGVSLQDFVITEIGVVGMVSSVAPLHSQVSTVLSPETTFGVMTTRGNVQGVLQNDILHARDGLARVSYIARDADIQEGDIVVTIGTDMFPGNQIIGEVAEVYDDPNGMSRHALVRPSEDAFRLSNVLVVTGFEGRAKSEDNE